MNRRHLLQTGTASLLLGISATACSSQSPASDSWRDVKNAYDDPRLTALASAILAPSPHNRQPWLIDLDETQPDQLTLYPDLSRLLPETDPPNRQILIGLGAFAEALHLASAEQNRQLDITLFPEGVDENRLDMRPIAHFRMNESGSASPDPLFKALPLRRTNRTPFSEQPVPDDLMQQIGRSIATESSLWNSTSYSQDTAGIRALCNEGWAIEMNTKRTHLESVALTRIGHDEIEANPDGISLSGPAIRAYSALGILTRDKMEDPDSRAFAESMKFYSKLIDSAQSFGWLISRDNDRVSQFNAGRDWMRIHLAATAAGIAFQSLSQVLQEFPEMSALYDQVHANLSISAPARIQGLFRLGYAKSPKPSPRWPLQTRLIDMPL